MYYYLYRERSCGRSYRGRVPPTPRITVWSRRGLPHAAWGVSEPCSMVAASLNGSQCSKLRPRQRSKCGKLRCDPCAHAPTPEQAADCRAPQMSCSNGTRTCAFIKALPKTLAFYWDARKTRGFGNFWPYLRTFHYSAAILGRRLLLAHQDHVLPTDHLALDGSVSWRLRPDDTQAYHVVHEADVAAWRAAGQEGGLLGLLQSLHDVDHVWLNVSSAFEISKWRMVAGECGGPTKQAEHFLWCTGRLFSSPTPKIAAEVARLRAQLPQGYRALHFRTFGGTRMSGGRHQLP